MNLRQIEVFRAVMMAGGITDAARLLNVTQPGVSRAVKHLELQLGVRLFQRLKGRLLPTEQARSLFDEVQLVYRGVQGVLNLAESLKEGAHATLRVVSSPSVGLDVVPRSIAKVRERLAQARFTLEILPSPGLVDALVSGHADVGLCAAEVDHPMLRINRVADMDMVCVAPPGVRFGARGYVRPADLAGQPFVQFESHTFQGRLVAGAFARAGVKVETIISVRFGRTACSLVSAGVGSAFVDELTVANVAAPDCVVLPIKPALRIPVSVVTPLQRPMSSLTEKFIACATTELRSALKNPALFRSVQEERTKSRTAVKR